MPSISKRCIQSLLSRLDIEKVKNLIYTDRNMHSGRCPALTDYFFNCVFVFLRVEFLIFFFIGSWMGTGVTHTSFVDSLLPAEVQEVWRQEESVTVFEPVQGNVVHAWSRQEPYLELSCNTTDVRAAADGEIMSIAHGMDEERIVRIRHEGGLETLYGNLASCAHEVGDRVYAGDAFATVLEGAPLAFELRRDGRSIDPTGLMLPLTE